MNATGLATILLLCALIPLSGCGDHGPTEPPLAGDLAGLAGHADPAGPGGPGGEKAATTELEFLLDLDAAFAATPWLQVDLVKLTDGTLRGFPASFPDGRPLELTPLNAQAMGVDVATLAVSVPAAAIPTPAGCILFRFGGLPSGSAFLVRSSVPHWIGVADLTDQHLTYRLAQTAGGLAAELAKAHDTPATPWITAPLEWVVYGGEPDRQMTDRWVIDPGGRVGDD